MNSNFNSNSNSNSESDSISYSDSNSNSNFSFDNNYSSNIIDITNIIKSIEEDSTTTTTTKSVPIIATDKVRDPVMTASVSAAVTTTITTITTKILLPTSYSFNENFGFDVPKNFNDYHIYSEEEEEDEKVNDSFAAAAADVSEKINDYSGIPGGEEEVNDYSDTEEEILGGIENSDEE